MLTAMRLMFLLPVLFVPCAFGYSLWSVPTNDSVYTDSQAVELGVKFRSDSAGTVTGIRFYKNRLSTGTHVGNLWTRTGTLLASATFSSESDSGWQQVFFSTPVSISADTVYVASYFCPNYYIATNDFFTETKGAPPLHALDTISAAGNGVYTYSTSSAFPVASFRGTNYWVDVVFSANSQPTQAASISSPDSVTIQAGETVNYQISMNPGSESGTPIYSIVSGPAYPTLLLGSSLLAGPVAETPAPREDTVVIHWVLGGQNGNFNLRIQVQPSARIGERTSTVQALGLRAESKRDGIVFQVNLGAPGEYKLVAFDVTGRRAWSHSAAGKPGTFKVFWPNAPAGVYAIVMKSNNQRIIRNVLLAR